MNPWILAVRPKTLPAAVVPVWVGCALAWKLRGAVDWPLAAFTLLGALCIQMATNLFNDAIDAGKGADTAERMGPRRVTASGLLSPRAVFAGGMLLLVLAAACGIPLLLERGWMMLVIGLPSLYLAYGYTGGPFPLAYRGLGELFVVLFFGLVAVMGTYFVQTGEWPWPAAVLGLQVGLLSAVLITINNLRDMEEDSRSGKRTLAVRWGRRPVRILLAAMVCVALVLCLPGLWYGAPWLAVLALPLYLLGGSIVRLVWRTEPGPAYNFFLALAALLLVLFAVAVHLALMI